jgi:hypothetical protein
MPATRESRGQGTSPSSAATTSVRCQGMAPEGCRGGQRESPRSTILCSDTAYDTRNNARAEKPVMKTGAWGGASLLALTRLFLGRALGPESMGSAAKSATISCPYTS